MRTPTTTLGAALAPDLIFSELMYHPTGNSKDLEFVELVNRGPEDVNLTGWSIRGAVSYVFPATILSPGQYIVICGSVWENYGSTGPCPKFDGDLANEGETITLNDPRGHVVHTVTYQPGWPWPSGA
ncbi:lamin tail domain-containing protein, partial [Planctomycetota bacterium]